MANTGAGVDIIGTEHGSHQLLRDVHFFIGTTRGGNASHSVFAVFGFYAFDFTGRVINRLFPANRLPFVLDTFSYHGCGDSVLMGSIAPGKAPFNTRVTVISAAVFIRHHAHHFFAFHFRVKGTAHTAISTSSGHTVLRHTVVNDGFFN